jgi:hypothetical protein
MHDWPPLLRRLRITSRRVVPAAAIVAAAVPCASAHAQALAPKVNVIGDSVIVTDQPSGSATIQVTRPDAVTGGPVVIGSFSGDVNGPTPFTVNTTTPTAFSPDGDCWQRGALSQALTPDILPGDTVTVTGQPSLFGGSASSTSVTVPADGPAGGAGGPIPSCRSIAPFAQNAVTAAPKSVSDGPIQVSGVAQPLATGVSSSVTDGARSTAPVDATPGADGTWSATTPAAQLHTLANGSLTVRPVFAVPDVSTGAPAHIVGAPLSVQKADAGGGGGQASRPGSRRPAKSVGGRVSRLRVRSRIPLAKARRRGLQASFVVPRDARVIDVRLLRGKHKVSSKVVPAGKAGTRQTVRLRGTALRRALRRGRYTLAVRAGPSRSRLGAAVAQTIRVA